MAAVDVLIPTNNRLHSLIVTLTGVAEQTLTDLRVVVADQSDEPVEDEAVVGALRRIVEARGGATESHYRMPRKGIAEQRDFLLRQATADHVLFLDDDVLIESWVVERLLETIREQSCGFVGAFPLQPSYAGNVRPDAERVEYWEGRVEPETVNPGSPEWRRASLHTAANLYHVSHRLPPGERRLYKVSWLGACAMYDRRKLLEIGGYGFWRRLPRYHSGEDVLVQNLLMRRWGGCGLMPSGTYFTEVPTTVLNPEGRVDAHALQLLPEWVERYAPGTEPPPPDAWRYW